MAARNESPKQERPSRGFRADSPGKLVLKREHDYRIFMTTRVMSSYCFAVPVKTSAALNMS
jgi:hypothetical protein